MRRIMKWLSVALIIQVLVGCDLPQSAEQLRSSPSPAAIFGDPKYRAISYGGYRGLTRDEAPTLEQVIEDMEILAAMGIKLLRTYNTSQYPLAELTLEAISALKAQDPDFEMYVMLGVWIEARNAWAEGVWDAENNRWVGDTAPDHTLGNIENNTREIDTAIRLANSHPDIVKAIAVGNEAMVQWATQYFVYPQVISKWVNYLQNLKATGKLTPEVWITSSDNYESWGGGNTVYQTQELVDLMHAVDFISVHTYPFHDSFYNSEFWGVLPEEEALDPQLMAAAVMHRAVDYAKSQYNAVVEYASSLGIEKPIHIGETGWATTDATAYGINGSKAADEYKQKLFHEYLREWTDSAGISLFYFEAFDERWKQAADPQGSENHFGLIGLDNTLKFTLWNAADAGVFDGLTRDGKPLVKSFSGDVNALMASALLPPFKSQMAVRRITTRNEMREPGETVTEQLYVVTHQTLSALEDGQASYPSAPLKLIPWEGTANIELLADGSVMVQPRGGDWWGASLELDADLGEDLSQFAGGTLRFEIKGSASAVFSVGFQTGSYLRGDQVNNFGTFGPGTAYEINDTWTSVALSIEDINGGTDLTDVTNIIAFLSQNKGGEQKILVRNIVFSQ